MLSLKVHQIGQLYNSGKVEIVKKCQKSDNTEVLSSLVSKFCFLLNRMGTICLMDYGEHDWKTEQLQFIKGKTSDQINFITL